MSSPTNEYETKIAELEHAMSELHAAIADKDKQLEKYQHLSSKYRRLKKTSAGYKRDRVILLLFSLMLIIGLCYQGIKRHSAKLEQEKLYQKYKTNNGEGPNGDIYTDPTP